MIEVYVFGRNKAFTFKRATPIEIYDSLGLYPSEWLAIYNNRIISDDQMVENGKVVLIPVVSGG